MAELTTSISVQIDKFDVSIPKEEYDLQQYFTNEELENTAKEFIYMEKHPQEYKTLNNIEELKADLLSND